MIKKNIILKLIFISGLLISNNALAKKITIAGGYVGGAYYPAALQICNLVNKYSDYKCNVISSNGSIQNIGLLEAQKVDFAMVKSDVMRDTKRGGNFYDNSKNYKGFRAVVTLFPEVFTLMVKDSKGISSFNDLDGKRIGLNLKGSGGKGGLATLFKYYKFEEDPEIMHVSESQMASKLCDGEVDALVMFTGHPSGVINKITNSCDIDFVSVGSIELERLLADNYIYERYNLPANSYPGVHVDTMTFSSRAMLVTNETTRADKVNLITQILTNHIDELKGSYPVFTGVDKAVMFDDKIIDLYGKDYDSVKY